MSCVNQIYRGSFSCDKLDLVKVFDQVKPFFSLVKLYASHPHMLKIIDRNSNTLLLFNSGKYRIMGGNIKDFDILRVIQSILNVSGDRRHHHHPPILQSETFVFNIGREINPSLVAAKHSTDRFVRYEGEIFCSLELLHWLPIHVNVFHSGKCVVLGREARNKLKTICEWIDNNICL